MSQAEISRLRARIEKCGRDDLTLYARATPQSIAEFERQWRVELPDDYREFLLQIGDGLEIKRQNGLVLSALTKAGGDGRAVAFIIPWPFRDVVYDHYMHGCKVWDELTGHEKIESEITIYLGYINWDYFTLTLSGARRGEVWRHRTFTWTPELYAATFGEALDKMID